MPRFLKQILSSEKGQALPAVLALLVIGGLTIAGGLNYTTTGLNSSRILAEDMKGIYAAEAGLEDTLWSLLNDISPSTQLPENINRMQVNMQTEVRGEKTIYLGELIEPGQHSDYLTVAGDMVWDGGADAYRYTITVTWQPGAPSVIHLEEVGARIPLGYSYQSGSAAGFAENLSTDEPSQTLDTSGAYLLNWELGTPLPDVSEEEPVETQSFYITGQGGQEGHYAWVVANRVDIGAVGEITGTAYQITATARRPEEGRTLAKIVADVMVQSDAGGNTVDIISWRISN